MNNFLENDEHDRGDYCCGGGGESGEEGEDGNRDSKQAGVDGERCEEYRDEGEDGANEEEAEHPV